MKKQKGFTLIELLAVIIVLAIISLIAVPIILGVIDNVRKAAFERSVEMAMKSFDLYSATNETVKRIEITDERLPLEDNNFIGGALIRLINGQIESQKITDGKYCASGKIGELEVTNGACINDALDKFVINSYFLQVNPNGGIWNETEEISEVLVENNKKIDLVNPERTGYAFTGWEMNVVGNIDDADNGTLTTEMKANWVGNKYKLVIDSAGGIYEESSENVIVDVVAGESIELKTPTREGYIFVGWEVTGQGSSIIKNLFTMGIENATVTAKWKGDQYTINYDCNGGSGSTESSVHNRDIASPLSPSGCYKIVEGKSIENKNAMVYYVTGWSTSKTAEKFDYAADANVTNLGLEDNITLYAVWGNLFNYTKNYEVVSDGLENFRIKLLESGVLTISKNMNIDVFLVGGGGGGNFGGGGGGKTRTVKNIPLDKAKSYSIAVGLGGSAGSGGKKMASNGELSSAFGYTIAGGGYGDYYDSDNGHYGHGGDGGSGGGGSFRGSGNGGAGGSNGGNGGSGKDNSGSGGTGQGTTLTTREFGETTGDIYAGGGGGCAGKSGVGGSGGEGGGGDGSQSMYGSAKSGIENTGGGGGGACYDGAAGSGGSGIVIIRNAR